MEYSENIKKAWDSYCKVMSNNDTSASQSDADYKRKTRNISRSYEKFVKACEAEGLDYMKVNSDLIPRSISISKPNTK